MAGVNDNLIPAKKGEIRNPKGKPKGTKHLSTWIQDMLNDEEFETAILDGKKGWKDYKGAPIKAIIQVAVIKAINEKDGHKWAEWLAKHGYGSKLVHEFENPIHAIIEKYGKKGGVDDIPGVEESEDRPSKDST